MLLAVQLLGPTGRPSRLQSFQTSPPPFGQPARDTTPVQIQQIRDLQNPPSLFVGLDSPEAHVFQYVVCQGPSIERHTQPIEYYPMEVKRNITLIMKRPIVTSQAGWWVYQFQQMEKQEQEMIDQSRAARLLDQGRECLAKSNTT